MENKEYINTNSSEQSNNMFKDLLPSVYSKFWTYNIYIGEYKNKKHTPWWNKIRISLFS